MEAATTSANGLMTSAMVTKLNGIATGANAYTLPNATSSVLGGVKIGSNITVSSGTISLTKSNVTTALGYTPPTTNTTYSVVSTSADGLCPKRGGTTTKFLRDDGTWATPPDTNTTYSAATTSANGLMSSSDKSKLDGIASGANAYSLPTASSSTLGGIKVGTNLSISNGVLSATNTTYSAATTSANGLMSSSDKTKLNGIATGAQVNNVVVSTSKPSSGDVWINPNGTSALDAVSVIGEYAEFRLTSHQSVSQSAN